MLGRLFKNILSRRPAVPAPAAEPAPRAPRGKPAVISFSGATTAKGLEGSTSALGELLTRHGYEFIELPFRDPDLIGRLNDALRGHNVAFAFGMAGMASGASDPATGRQIDIWGDSGVPFLKIMGDHPAYFLERHVDTSPNVVNVYGSPEHWDFYRRVFRRDNLSAVLPLYPLDPIAPADINPERKAQGAILLLKNGNDPEALCDLWDAQLAPPVARCLKELAEELRARIANLTVEDIESEVRRYFEARGVDPAANLRLLCLYLAQLDDYARRVKSTLLATALLDLPVEIHGYHWEHVDFHGRRAKWVRSGDYFTSRQLMRDALAVIDMTANTRRLPHERFMRALGRYTFCISNETDWVQRQFPAHHHALSYSFTADSIRDRVERTLGDRQATVQAGVEMGRAAHATLPEQLVVDFLQSVSEHVRLASGDEPALQSYFLWPQSRREPGVK